MLKNAFIPYKGYYSTPFCRWQGSLALDNAIELGAKTSKRWLSAQGWEPTIFDYMIFGNTIGQHHQFYSSPWAAHMMGARLPAVAMSQACTTSTTCLFFGAMGVELGLFQNVYVLLVDRCSNGPHTIWPNPLGPGGEVISENWLMDNFNCDPAVGNKMIETAENVARETGITREECDDLTVRRYEQYLDSLKNDREFQKRYMFPVEATVTKKETRLVEEDEGITPVIKDVITKMKPVIPGGVLTFATQTHPADGNAGIIVTTKDKAKELSKDPNVTIQVISYGFAREKPGFMAMAPVPAAKMALKNAGLDTKDIKVIKTHNPFIVNDIYMSKQLGIDPYKFNNYGSSIIYGHPQGPTAARLIIEGIEETVLLGGGYMLWAGCAAGDTGASLILKIS